MDPLGEGETIERVIFIKRQFGPVMTTANVKCQVRLKLLSFVSHYQIIIIPLKLGSWSWLERDNRDDSVYHTALVLFFKQ